MTQNNVNFATIVARFAHLLEIVSTLMKFQLKPDFKSEIQGVIDEIKASKPVKAVYVVHLSRGVESLLYKYFAKQDFWMTKSIENLIQSDFGLDQDLEALIQKHRKTFVEAMRIQSDDLKVCADAYNTFHMSLVHIETEQKARVQKRAEARKAQVEQEREDKIAKTQRKYERKVARRAKQPEVVIPVEQLRPLANITL